MPIRTKRGQYLYDKLIELYTLLYKESTPSVDFKELMESSYWIRMNHYPNEYFNMSPEEKKEFEKTFERYTRKNPDELTEDEAISKGYQREIPYNDFFIDDNKFHKIVDDFLRDKKNKLSKIERTQMRNTVYLGCSPIGVDINKEGEITDEYVKERREKNRNYYKTNILIDYESK